MPPVEVTRGTRRPDTLKEAHGMCLIRGEIKFQELGTVIETKETVSERNDMCDERDVRGETVAGPDGAGRGHWAGEEGEFGEEE